MEPSDRQTDRQTDRVDNNQEPANSSSWSSLKVALFGAVMAVAGAAGSIT
ncbi:MAG: hypothetical protein ACK5HO_11680 [Pseudomonadota bacterium]